jgi:hypothetical protein
MRLDGVERIGYEFARMPPDTIVSRDSSGLPALRRGDGLSG